MAVYDKKYELEGASSYKETFSMENFHLYGSERLGTYAPKEDQKEVASRTFVVSKIDTEGAFEEVTTKIQSTQLVTMDFLNHYIGNRSYEGKNHLGNVLVVFTDAKEALDFDNNGIIDAYEAIVVSANDYYPFGSLMPKRKFSGVSYRYGFNGMEKDDEVKGEWNSYTATWRAYDPRLGRWMSIDPKFVKYPWQSPYAAFNNNPILTTDPRGDDPPPRYNQTGNVVIVLKDASENYSEVQFGKNWDMIVVNNLSEATEWLKNTYGKDEGKINNLAIITHGSSTTGSVGKESIVVREEGKTWETAPGYLALTADDIKNYTSDKEKINNMSPLDKAKNEQIGELKEIASYLGDGSETVFSACWAGGNQELTEAIYKTIMNSENTLYMSKDESYFKTESKTNAQVTFNSTSIDVHNPNSGYTQTTPKGTKDLGKKELKLDDNGKKGDIKVK